MIKYYYSIVSVVDRREISRDQAIELLRSKHRDPEHALDQLTVRQGLLLEFGGYVHKVEPEDEAALLELNEEVAVKCKEYEDYPRLRRKKKAAYYVLWNGARPKKICRKEALVLVAKSCNLRINRTLTHGTAVSPLDIDTASEILDCTERARPVTGAFFHVWRSDIE